MFSTMTRQLTVRCFLGLVWLAAGSLATGCASSAGKAPGAPATEAPAEDGADSEEVGPTSLDGAAAELDRAERQVLAALGTEGAAAGEPRPAYAETPEPPDSPAEAPAPAPGEREGTYRATAADRCHVACRALASMQRAAERLCSIAGDDDARCSQAERRVSHATDLVRRSCESCS